MQVNGFLDYKIFPITDLEQSAIAIEESQKKSILLVYLDEMRPELVTFLGKIMAALKLDMDNACHVVAVTDVAKLSNFSTLSRQQGFDKVLVFGISPPQLGLQVESTLYQPFELQLHTFLFADNLSKIEGDRILKGALWTRLQTMFLQT